MVLYSASWSKSHNYYDDCYDKQYPYDGAKVEEGKAKEPQYDKYYSNHEKKIECAHFQNPSYP